MRVDEAVALDERVLVLGHVEDDAAVFPLVAGDADEFFEKTLVGVTFGPTFASKVVLQMFLVPLLELLRPGVLLLRRHHSRSVVGADDHVDQSRAFAQSVTTRV